MTRHRVGATEVRLCDGWTEIILPGDRCLSIPWAEKAGDAALASELGYASAEAMNRDHDALHALVAEMMGLPESPVLAHAAGGPVHPLWRYEEALVFATARYLNAAGLTAADLMRMR